MSETQRYTIRDRERYVWDVLDERGFIVVSEYQVSSREGLSPRLEALVDQANRVPELLAEIERLKAVQPISDLERIQRSYSSGAQGSVQP